MMTIALPKNDVPSRHMGLRFLLIFCLTGFAFNTYAQDDDFFGAAEDDSLLFGDEFDLGGDDFSFDLEDEGESIEGAEDDEFSFSFDDDEEEADSTAEEADTTAGDEWGLESSDDYEDLITKQKDGEDMSLEDTDHPLDLRKYFRGTPLENTGLIISLYSPQKVTPELETWYSFMDVSLSAELPWHYEFDPVSVAFLVDISTFSFQNSFPAGGSFRGLSLMPTARAEAFGAEVELGLGMYYPTIGILAGFGYSYQYHSIFASAGYRWNWAYNIDPIGSGWWFEPRFTAGVKLW
jgi:hypothetical protein